MSHIVYIGVGSNLGERLRNCEGAVLRLSNVLAVSKWRETKALTTSTSQEVDKSSGREVEGRDDVMTCRLADFINGAIKIETTLSPQELLTVLQKIEADMGRVRTGKKWESRVIDLDILFYDDVVIDSPDLKIPHPELHKRMFVLEPLCDIAPTFVHPILKKEIQNL